MWIHSTVFATVYLYVYVDEHDRRDRMIVIGDHECTCLKLPVSSNFASGLFEHMWLGTLRYAPTIPEMAPCA